MAPQGLQRLMLTIKNCHQLKQVIKIPEDNRVENDIVLQQLQFLRSLPELAMSSCPQLSDSSVPLAAKDATLQGVRLSAFKEFLSTSKHLQLIEAIEDHNLVPDVKEDGLNGLTSLELTSCKDVECLVDTTTNNGPTSAFTHLKTLYLTHADGLESLCKGQPPQGFLENLKELHVGFLPELESLFSHSLIQSLVLLEKLKIWSCPELKTLFGEPENDGEVESETSSSRPLCLPKLKTLDISQCSKLEYVMPITLAQGLPALESVSVEECGELKTLLGEPENDGEVESETSSSRPLCLPKLKTLDISLCSKLEYVVPITLAQGLPALESVSVNGCDELKTLFGELENDGEVESETSSSRPLCLPKLKTLEIHDCSKLAYVVPITLAQGLPALESVSVNGCDELKQVLGMAKEEDGVEHDLHLPSLQDVTLGTLKSLTSFVPDNYTVKAPALKTFEISACPKAMKVSIQQELNKQLKLELWGSSISVFKELSCNTKDVIIRWVSDHRKNMVPDVVDLEHLDGLTSLRIRDWENCKCLVDASQAMMGLESQKHEEGLYNRQENQAPPMTFSKLEHLELERFSELRWIVKGPTHCVNLQGLKLLRISRCYKLKYLFSVSVVQTLRSLEELKIDHCEGLKSVFTELESDDGIQSNTLCSLPNLKTVDIGSCRRLEFVFPLSLARGLPRLQKVKLYKLVSLESLAAGNNFLEAPALEILDILYCPAFQGHVNNCSTLNELKLLMSKRDGEDAESCNMVDTQLEQTSPNHECLTLGNFGQLFQLQGGYFISSLEKITLANPIWLRDIWKGPIHVATNLRELEVHDCNNLTYIFPVMLIPHLPQLSILKISSCHNLKQIIANDDTWASSSSSQGPQLEKKIIFPRLKKIVLEDLSRLESFSPVDYHLEFTCLELLDVKKCLKMVTSFTVDYLTLTVHAQTDQASRLDDASPSQKDIFWRRRIPHKM